MMAAEDSDMKNTSNVDIETYRKLVQTYISLHIYQAALFWADKVVALSCGNPRDVYWLAQCMFLMKQYHRGAHLLRIRNLDKTYILCNKLTVQCLLEANEYSEALRVLNSMNLDVFLQTSTYGGSKAEYGMFDDTPIPQVQSSVLLLKGKVLEAMDNRGLASDCYRQALQCDVYCYEAFESLVQHQMLSAEEEEELLHSLPISDQCTPDETEILLLLYRSKLKKYHTPKNLPDTSKLDPLKSTKTLLGFIPLPTDTPHPLLLGDISTTSIPKFTPSIATTTTEGNKQTSSKKHHRTSNVSTQDSVKVEESQTVEVLIERLHSSLDMIVSHAEHLYYNCEYQRCTTYTEHILKQDPYHSACLPIHISCQVELKNPNKLFTLAHNLVDLYPNLAISWFAVGCYYYIIPGKSDQARRYLAKATSLDRLFGPAWLAYGHSFAIENEHDQAMAAYFKASQLMKGCHLPLMYIGLECGLTNNVRLAEKFFNQANKIAPNDPFVLHEMGVIAHQNLDYNSAELYFNNALKIIRNQKDKLMPERWAPLLNNLAHTLRKQKKYEQALIYHHEALVLLPQTASTYSSIAYIYALMNKCEEAVDWFHKALGLRRDDTFSTTMLNYVIEQLSEDQRPYPDAPDFIPDFNIHMKSEKEAEQTGSSETLEQTSTSCMTPGVPESANSNATVNMSISMDMDMSEVGTPK